MKARFRRLQHLMTPLRVFEASARHGSFTRAAEELTLSQPSVSRHIATLEQDLGVTLFHRNHNKLQLTAPGRSLSSAVGRGLSDILEAVELVSSNPERGGLILACTQTFAHGWLMPRFSSLRRGAGDEPINLAVSLWLKDINLREVDMVFGWRAEGQTDWPRLPLFPERIYPVCAPGYPGAGQRPLSAEDLLEERLLQFDMPEAAHAFWPEWFDHFGLSYKEPNSGYRHSNYQFMMQAALDGEGIALGWHHLVADHVKAGRLVRAGPVFAPEDSVYSIEYRPEKVEQTNMRRVLEWFRRQAVALDPPHLSGPV